MKEWINGRPVRGIAAVVLGMLGCILSITATAQEIVPHVARYQLAVEQIRMPGIVGTSGGDLIIRLERRCKDWALFSRMEFTLHGGGGETVRMESLSGLQEGLEGGSLRFRTEQRVNGQVIDELAGEVSGSHVTFSKPEDAMAKELPAKVLLPVQSMKLTLKQLADRSKIRTYKFFGGDDQDAVRVSDLWLGDGMPLERAPAGNSELVSGDAARMVSSFFPLSSADSEPIFVSTYDILTNGVVTRLSLDGEALVAKGTLTHLEKLSSPECANGT